MEIVMKVTKTRMRLYALWNTMLNAHLALKLQYLKFLVPMLKAYDENPNIKW